MFRYSATLIDVIDASTLQQALNKAVDLFPSFNVCLRSGMFWHYLEQSHDTPEVSRENLPICYGLHVDTKSVLFRVSYYQNRINFEVSHIVSDGRGSLNFFKALLYTYIQRQYGVEDVQIEYDGSDRQKSENSFDKYFERDKITTENNGAKTDVPKPKIYRLSGFKDVADATFIEYHLPTGKTRDLARSYGVSLTSLIIAAIMKSISMEMARRERNRAIRIDIPVDLRRIFESETTKNFFGLAYVSYVPKENETVHHIALKIQEQFKTATQEDQLKPRMNRMIALEKNPFIRYAPLFVKDIGLEIGDWWTARETTTTVSNLGPITINSKLASYLKDINILTSASGMKFTFCSFGEDLSIGISTVFTNLDIIKNFCRFFSSKEIYGHININKTSEEVAAHLREAKIEVSVKRLGDQISRNTNASKKDIS